MKILLIYPPLTLHKLDVSPPSKSALIGLGYIGGVLQKEGYTVKILDCLSSSFRKNAIDSDFFRFGLLDKEILEEIKSFDPDVVGISCMFTPYFKDAHNVARIIKEYNKKILIVFGGAHVSSFYQETMKDNNIDLSVIGEGENTICEVLERYRNKKDFYGIKGLAYRVNGELKQEEARESIEKLDNIPFPAWNLLEKDMKIVRQEQQKNKFLLRKPVGYILTSRGCPNGCYFCTVKLIWGRKWRVRSAKNIVDEIELLKNRYGYKEIHFIDDNSSVSKKRMHEICDELLNRNLNVKLATPTGIAVNTLDEEILIKMKKAGFYRLCFGIETADPNAQKIIKKHVNLNKAREIITKANSIGFWTAATFIVGFPHDTWKEIKATINFIKDTNLDFIVCYLLVPQIGTEVYDKLKQEGLIDLDKYIDPYSKEWYKISLMYNNGFKTSFFSNSQLQDISSKIYKEYLIHKIFSLKTYSNLFRKIKSLEDLRYMLGLISFPMEMLKKMIIDGVLSNVTIHMKNKKLKNVDI